MAAHEHSSDLGRWRVAQRDSHPTLRPFVRGYLASSSFLPAPVRERHLPSVEVPLVLNFGAPHRRLETAGAQDWTDRDGAWIVGLHDRHQLSDAIGEREFMIVRFTPLGAHHFLRSPMHPIAGRAVELSALDAKLAAQVMSRVGTARGSAERFDAMEGLIAERVAPAVGSDGLAWAWDRLEAADGRVPLAALAAELDCSHRVMIARFRTGIGVSPKAVARLLRFNRVLRSLELGRTGGGRSGGKPFVESRTPGEQPALAVDWADIAADCGYFDQSHFIREFRQFAGATPTEFLRLMSGVG